MPSIPASAMSGLALAALPSRDSSPSFGTSESSGTSTSAIDAAGSDGIGVRLGRSVSPNSLWRAFILSGSISDSA